MNILDFIENIVIYKNNDFYPNHLSSFYKLTS